MRKLLALVVAAACSPVEPPVVEANALADTADTAGPYAVEARVSARREITRVELVWHNTAAAGRGALRTVMEHDVSGVWRASIPGLGRGARVAYHVEAIDAEGDRG